MRSIASYQLSRSLLLRPAASLGAAARRSAGRPTARAAGELLPSIADTAAALGGHVHRARQGADASALRELPPGRRPAAPGRLRAACISRRSSAAPTAWRSSRCAAPICHQEANFDPGRVPGHPDGTSRRARNGVGGQDARRDLHPDQGSGAQRQPHAGGPVHHIGDDTLVGWAWAPGYGRQPAPGTQKIAGALVEAWVKTGAACPN